MSYVGIAFGLALLGIAAAPASAAVVLQSAYVDFSTVLDFESFEPGVGTINRSFGFSDIGGCEGADESGENCGGSENSSFSLTLTNGSLNYAAQISQNHAMTFFLPDTSIDVFAEFRSDRQMRFGVTEHRQVDIIPCGGYCPNSLTSSFGQTQQGDGSWIGFVSVSTSAAVREAVQHVDHRLMVKVSEVPEPGSWMLMIAGFGLAGAALRRQQSQRVSPLI